jgi:hypothetical protein
MPDDNTLYREEEEIPFPEVGDRLFVTGHDSGDNAPVINWANYSDSTTSYKYVLGYKAAADRLARSLLEDRSSLDLIIFPMVFLYRQYLELSLKRLLREGSRVFDKQFVLPKHHRIDTLWSQCKSLIGPGVKDEDVVALEACINEFSTIDPSSMAFRYHVDTHNNPSLPPDLKYIDIRNLAQVMAKIHSFIGTMYEMIEVWLMQKEIDEYPKQLELLKAELEEEYRNYSDED